MVTMHGKSETLVSAQVIDDLSEPITPTTDEAKVATAVKKRKCCSICPFTYWWQTRCRSKEG
jgi:hypothetical protein